MKCPRCPGSLTPQKYEQISIDRCSGCGGTWLDAGEIQTLNRTQDATFSPEMTASALQGAGTGVSLEEHRSVELCPKCSARMNPMNFNYSSGVIVDLCPNQHGMWLDSAELDKVQIHWEHWEKQRKEKSGAWGQMAQAEARKATADADQSRVGMQKSLGVISRTLDRVFHAIEKSRRQGD